jgi:hypothetical protein
MSINTPPNSSLLAAQAMTFFKGQETQSRESNEQKEKERLLNLQLTQARKQKLQTKPAGAEKGVLA